MKEPIFDVNEYIRKQYATWLKQHSNERNFSFLQRTPVFSRALCQDGYSVSIQASASHYCLPRTTNAPEYAAFELGYPSDDDMLIDGYEDYGVYPYVPTDIVNKLLEKHGGIVYWE